MIRNAEPEDAEAIGLIRVAAWRAAYQAFMPQGFLSSLDPGNNLGELRERLSNQNANFTVFVADVKKSVVGFAIVGKPRYKANRQSVELWALNVLPQYWRRGIGSALVDRVARHADTLGFEKLELWCLEGNRPAQEAYRKLGFVESGQDRSSSELTGHLLHELHYEKVL